MLLCGPSGGKETEEFYAIPAAHGTFPIDKSLLKLGAEPPSCSLMSLLAWLQPGTSLPLQFPFSLDRVR